MGFNRRKMESERAAAAAKEAKARRALGRQIVEDAERLIATWNARQEGHMPMLFSPTIGAAFIARDIGFSGFDAQPAGPQRRSTCALLIVTRTPRSQPHPGPVVPIMPAECAVR